MIIRSALLFFCLALYTSCGDPNQSEKPNNEVVDSLAAVPDNITTDTAAALPPPTEYTVTTTGSSRDTISYSSIKKKLQGTLAFCFFSKINCDEYKDFVVYIQFDKQAPERIDTAFLYRHLEEIRAEAKSINAVMDDSCEKKILPTIAAYDSIRVKLEVNEHHFSKSLLIGSTTQMINQTSGNKWSWRLQPKIKDNITSNVRVSVEALLPQGNYDVIDDRFVDIKVAIRSNGYEQFKNLIKDVGFFWTALLIPLLAFSRKIRNYFRPSKNKPTEIP